MYVNGDSWTSGWPLEETQGHRESSWPHLLSQLTSLKVVNDARAGCSNYRIYRKTFDYILNYKPAIAIVCLTQWSRFELGDTRTGKIHQYIPGHKESKSLYLTHWHPYLEYSNFLRQIISLQKISTQSTKLYFVDTFKDNLQKNLNLDWFKQILNYNDVFHQMDDSRIEKKFSVVFNLNKHINYHNFILDKSYQELIEGCELVKGHPVLSGHMKFAEILYDKIFKENNYHG
jgi:hypothetical protein